MHKEYGQQVEQIHHESEQKIGEQKIDFAKKINQQEESFKFELDKDKKQYDSQAIQMHDNYQKTFEKNNQFYSDNLKRQNDQFQDNYRHTVGSQKESLNVQKEMFIRELNEMKQKQLVDVHDIKQHEEDSFYRVKNNGSKLSETGKMYVLRTYLPEAEKDNINVRIKGDKATVSGKRTFADELEKDGKKVSTNSYQTFREEFHLSHPVAPTAIFQQRDGDYLDVIIPKIGFMDKKA